MRSRSISILLLLPLLALAQDKVQFTPKYEKGQKLQQNLEMTLTLTSVEAKVSGKIVTDVTEASAEKTSLSFNWDNLKVLLNDEEQTVPMDVCKVTLDKDGFVKNLDGGIQGADQTRMFLTTYFIPPTKAVAANDTWTTVMPKNDFLSLGEITYSGKYLGSEKLGEVSAHKFQLTMAEKGNDFSVDSTVWADASGATLKMEGKFKNMPVPVANESANGSFKLEKAK